MQYLRINLFRCFFLFYAKMFLGTCDILKIVAIYFLVIFVTASATKNVSLLGSPCKTDTECSGNLAICVRNHCTCNVSVATLNFDKSKCLELAVKSGDSCEETVQCEWGSLGYGGECVKGICQCGPEFYTTSRGGNECLPMRDTIGAKCDESGQCTATIGHLSECSGGRCTCSLGSVESDDRKRCIRENVPIGGRCDNQGDCSGENRDCTISGYCTCLSGYTANWDGTSCLSISYYLGAQCETPVQCKMGPPGDCSDCINSSCVCTENAVNEPGEHVCYPKAVKVGDPCKINAQCEANLEAAYCGLCEDKGHCRCRSRSVASADASKCLLIKVLDENCLEDGQCIEGAVCLPKSGNTTAFKRCTCAPEVYVRGEANPEKCLMKRFNLNDSCDEDIQCMDVFWQANGTCVEHECTFTPANNIGLA